jgi:hypothetical protein
MHKVQQRTLRATSTDSHYVAVAYKYMRHYAMWLREQLVEVESDMSVISASCDDKCKVLSRIFLHDYVAIDVDILVLIL